MSAEFNVNYEQIQKLQDAIIAYGDGAEDIINDFLANEANDMFQESIVELIPVSDRNKKHAKNSNALVGENIQNLVLYIHTKTPYNYLYFPDEGVGTSKNNEAQNFMQYGVNREADNVINEIIERLQTNLKL